MTNIPTVLMYKRKLAAILLSLFLGGAAVIFFWGNSSAKADIFLNPSSPSDELVDTPWPTRQHDLRRTGRSPYEGITTTPLVIWQYGFSRYSGMGGGLTVGVSNTLYVKHNSGTAVLDSEGHLVRNLPPGGSCGSTPTLGKDRIYYGANGTYYALTYEGSTVWGISNANLCIHSTSAISGNRAYFGIGSYFVAADATTGAIQWTTALGQWGGHGTPALGPDGTIYVSNSQFPPGFYALRPDGTLKWSSGYGYGTDPVVGDDGTIYSAGDGLLTAFNPDGTVKWHFAFPEDVCSFVSPALASDGTIYLGTVRNGTYDTETNFYAVNPDGTMKWSYTIYKDGWPRICSSPVVDNQDNVYFCADTGRCYALNKNGSKLWEFLIQEGAWLRTSPSIADNGVIYVAGSSVYALIGSTERQYLPLIQR